MPPPAPSRPRSDPDEAGRLATFSITVVWILAATAMLTWGFLGRLRPLRHAALALLALTAAKLIVVDMAGSQQVYRIIAFITTGLVFVGASWAYHAAAQRWLRPSTAANNSPPGQA